MSKRLTPIITVVIFVAAAWLLWHQLRGIRPREIMTAVQNLQTGQVLLALALAAASYWWLTLYDVLAFHHIGRKIAYWRIALASFLSFAVSHNAGFGFVTGAPLRYRIHGEVGVSPAEIAIVTVFCAFSVALGATTLVGCALLFEPRAAQAVVGLPLLPIRIGGALTLLAVASYPVICFFRTGNIRIGAWNVPIPKPQVALTQIAMAVADLSLAGTILYSLLHADVGVSLPVFVGVYALAVSAGLISNVPGGLGVFESALLLLLPEAPSAAVLGGAVAFRLVYYLVPLGVAAITLTASEVIRGRRFVAQAGTAVWRLSPTLLGLCAFVGGAILMFSGATPASAARIAVLRQAIPLPMIEAAQAISCLAGFALMWVARGLYRRLATAYWLACGMLGVGIAAMLLKGLDYEEAIGVSVVLAALIPARAAFYRRSSFLALPLPATWAAGMVVVAAAAAWIGVLLHRMAALRGLQLTRFSYVADTPRFVRAELVVLAAVVLLVLYVMIRGRAPRPGLPTPADMSVVRSILHLSHAAHGHLALLGDNRILFSESGRAFLMYGIHGKSWIALGEPVGPEEEHADLIWHFRELCEWFSASPVIYQVSDRLSATFADVGLTTFRIGDEARVSLSSLSSANAAIAEVRELARAGYQFEVVASADVATLLPDLSRVSERWLGASGGNERRFAFGLFDPVYVVTTPCAIVRREGAVVAFATILVGAEGGDVAIDLLRWDPSCPVGMGDFLRAEVLTWARTRALWFDLGLVPMPELASDPLAPIWRRVGRYLYGDGSPGTDLEAIRGSADKFAPEWSPRYLVLSGGIQLAATLYDCAVLVSGGKELPSAR